VTAAVPPVAARRPRALVQHGVTRTDDYAWLADVNAGDVLAYLSAERGYYEEATAALEPRRQALAAELRGHVPSEDASVPWRHGAVEYRTRISADEDHERILRLDADGAEHLVLDGATVAGGGPHLTYGVLLPTRDGARLAYSVDLVGEELYELRFRDLATGEDLPDRIPGVLAGGAWSADGSRFFYLLPEGVNCPNCDAQTIRVESKKLNFLMPRFRTSWCLECGWHGMLRETDQPAVASKVSHSGQLPVSSKKSSK